MKTTVVIATRNRAPELDRTLHTLAGTCPGVPVIVVDNASDDGTADVARAQSDAERPVRLIGLPENLGAAARTAGVHAAGTPYVAFCDDDSWWEAGSLQEAEALLDRHERIGALTARTLVGPAAREDPVTPLLENSPLGAGPQLPGPRVLGFLACSTIVRTRAYLEVGGFSPVLQFGAEERLLALDLAAAGWELCYVRSLLVQHWPSNDRPAPAWRRSRELRNNLLIDVMRRPASRCLRSTARLARAATRSGDARAALRDAASLLPQALAHRRRLPDVIERAARTVERAGR